MVLMRLPYLVVVFSILIILLALGCKDEPEPPTLLPPEPFPIETNRLNALHPSSTPYEINGNKGWVRASR